MTNLEEYSHDRCKPIHFKCTVISRVQQRIGYLATDSMKRTQIPYWGPHVQRAFFYLEISETAADADVVTRGLNAQEMEVAGREVFIVHKALQSLSSG